MIFCLPINGIGERSKPTYCSRLSADFLCEGHCTRDSKYTRGNSTIYSHSLAQNVHSSIIMLCSSCVCVCTAEEQVWGTAKEAPGLGAGRPGKTGPVNHSSKQQVQRVEFSLRVVLLFGSRGKVCTYRTVQYRTCITTQDMLGAYSRNTLSGHQWMCLEVPLFQGLNCFVLAQREKLSLLKSFHFPPHPHATSSPLTVRKCSAGRTEAHQVHLLSPLLVHKMILVILDHVFTFCLPMYVLPLYICNTISAVYYDKLVL